MPNFDHLSHSLPSTLSDQFRSFSDSYFAFEGISVPGMYQGMDQFDYPDCIDAFVDGSLVQGCNFPNRSDPLDVKNDSWQTIKWQHTVLTEPDFLDEWSAQDIAFHLAYEVNGSRPPSTQVHQQVSQKAHNPHLKSPRSVLMT